MTAATNFDPNTPIYIQIMDFIKLDIVNKKIRGGEKMKSVRELAEELQVNPNTVQRAYQELERENIMSTQRGTGKFVTTDEEKINSLRNNMAQQVIESFINGMKNLGFEDKKIVDSLNEYLDKEKM